MARLKIELLANYYYYYIINSSSLFNHYSFSAMQELLGFVSDIKKQADDNFKQLHIHRAE